MPLLSLVLVAAGEVKNALSVVWESAVGSANARDVDDADDVMGVALMLGRVLERKEKRRK